jgi:SnoaL-like domain
MHPNALQLQRLFSSLNRHDHVTMAFCYHSAARFRDIAFDLRGRQEIHDMWRMICHGDIRATFDVVDANDDDGYVKLVDEYTFHADDAVPSDGRVPVPGRSVRNVIDSRFHFSEGLIIEHEDSCDPRLWADMALGGAAGFLAGRIRLLRSWKAKQKLKEFVRSHPEDRLPV